MAAVTFLSLGAALGMAQFAFGVFIIPLEEEFGWTRTQINVSLTLGVFTGFLAPFAGRLLDRYGARWIMATSLGLLAAGLLLRAVMTELWQFYLFSGLIFLGTPGAAMLPVGRLVSLWFSRTRGRMMGMVTAGNNFGGMVSVPIAAGMIALAGWRWSFAGMGLLVLAVMVLVVIVIRDRPEDVQKEVGRRWAPRGEGGEAARAALGGYTTRQALHTSAFWFLMIGMTLQQFARTAVVTQLAPHLEHVGFSAGGAATGLSVLAFFAMASKIIFGRMSETITARYAYVVIVSLQVIGLALLVLSGGSAVAWAALAVFGLGIGGVGALGPLAVVEVFGLRNYGGIMGLTRPAITIPVVAGPIMAGMIFDAFGKYDIAFLITIGLLVGAIASFLLARPPRRDRPSGHA